MDGTGWEICKCRSVGHSLVLFFDLGSVGLGHLPSVHSLAAHISRLEHTNGLPVAVVGKLRLYSVLMSSIIWILQCHPPPRLRKRVQDPPVVIYIHRSPPLLPTPSPPPFLPSLKRFVHPYLIQQHLHNPNIRDICYLRPCACR